MKERKNKQPISFHYTNEQMVRDLLGITPISGSVLDAGSGKNKVWFNEVGALEKYECEIEDGCDFYAWDKKVDWIVSNPPFHEGKDFLLKSSDIAQKGMAFLVNMQCFNSFMVPSRLDILKEKGFSIQKIHIVQDKRWFGRYLYIIFTKEESNLISWNKKTYG